jgi:hypothetical protein
MPEKELTQWHIVRDAAEAIAKLAEEARLNPVKAELAKIMISTKISTIHMQGIR